MRKEIHLCRSQEGHLWNTRGITNILGKLSKSLEEMGYNWCVMNKIFDNKQCTILWYVDDLNTSHVDPAVFPRVLADIYAEYGNIAKMTIT